jgi:hypothetical protein
MRPVRLVKAYYEVHFSNVVPDDQIRHRVQTDRYVPIEECFLDDYTDSDYEDESSSDSESSEDDCSDE